MTIPAFPLQWPVGWKRTDASWRTRAKFGRQKQSDHGNWKTRADLSIAEAVDRVRTELQRMGIHDDDLVISTNLQLRLDGLPRSSQRDPEDPGVAVYWTDAASAGTPPRCMAIDRYDRVADNLAAVAATLDAMRAIERHGGAEILNRAFTGFVALPAPEVQDPWWVALGFATKAELTAMACILAPPAQTLADIEREEHQLVVDAYRRLRSQHHPDKPGGDVTAFRRVQAAYDRYQQERPRG